MKGQSVPFGMSCGEAGEYAYKALEVANQQGAAAMAELSTLIINMLIELWGAHKSADHWGRFDDIIRELELLQSQTAGVARLIAMQGDSGCGGGFGFGGSAPDGKQRGRGKDSDPSGPGM